VFPKGNPDAFAKYAFNTFDTDGSGKVSFREFLIAIATTHCKNLDEQLKHSFRMYDMNNDGQVDLKEVTAMITAVYDLKGVPKSERTGNNSPKLKAQSIMKHCDKDSSKTLSEDEFVDCCLKDKYIRELLTIH
jgi:Ca2+-binding EF-hand superfamily protein